MNNNIAIVSGISSMEALLDRMKNGVSEVFLGYIDDDWYSDYGYLISPNRRWGKDANFSSLEEIKKVIDYAHENNMKVSFTLNSHRYTDNQLDKISIMLDKVMALGIDNIIISDFTLIQVIKNKFPHINIHVSTGGAVFNSESVKFYKSLGAKRIILPRTLTVRETINISKKVKDMEYEVFINGSRCANIDGLCNFEHTIMSIGASYFDNYPMCSLKYNIKLFSKKEISLKEEQNIINGVKSRQCFNSYPKACAGCYLYDYYHSGILHVKIPARAMNSEENKRVINKEIEFINKCIGSISKFPSSYEYKKHVRKMYLDYFDFACYENCERCYYSES